MKKKFFSIFIALVLALSLCLVTAGPVSAANPSSVEFATAVDGTAGYSTDYAHSGVYSVGFHTDIFDWTNHYAVGMPVGIPLNQITTLSYWRNGVGFEAKGFVDYAPPSVLLCIDANNDGKLDFDTNG
ncbi:unnamed protein product, partial [marine sediment metagenome]